MALSGAIRVAVAVALAVSKSGLKERVCCAIFAVLQITITACLADDSNALAGDLQQAINAGNDARVVQDCDTLINRSPQSWMFHYLRANALTNLGRSQEARAEYSYTISHTGDAHIAQMCRDALEPPTGNSTSARISRQAASVGNASLEQGKSEQASWAQTGINQARAVPDRAAQMAGEQVRFGRTYVPKYTPAQLGYQHNQDVDEKNMRVLDAKTKGDAHYSAAQAKSSAADAAAANLSSQFNATNKDGFHLSQQGTNFYVRQYAPAQPSNASSDLHPANASISDSADAKRGVFQSPLEAKAKALDPAAQKALDVENAKLRKGNVYGNLVPQKSR